jgi:hypothetical protein
MPDLLHAYSHRGADARTPSWTRSSTLPSLSCQRFRRCPPRSADARDLLESSRMTTTISRSSARPEHPDVRSERESNEDGGVRSLRMSGFSWSVTEQSMAIRRAKIPNPGDVAAKHRDEVSLSVHDGHHEREGYRTPRAAPYHLQRDEAVRRDAKGMYHCRNSIHRASQGVGAPSSVEPASELRKAKRTSGLIVGHTVVTRLVREKLARAQSPSASFPPPGPLRRPSSPSGAGPCGRRNPRPPQSAERQQRAFSDAGTSLLDAVSGSSCRTRERTLSYQRTSSIVYEADLFKCYGQGRR